MKKRIQYIILTQIIPLLRGVRGVFFILLVTSLQTIAQTFPVQVIPQVTPPPPVYLSDYASTNNSADRVRAQILLTDLTVLNRQVQLKLYIEGNGINTQSRDFIIGAQPIFLDGGIPVQLGSIDLAPYFELQNLQGISAGAYANAIPEGLYQFCFEVYDVLSGNRISNKSCTNVLIFLNDPPFLNLPENNINLEAYNPQNILFQWTPRHINVSNVAYEFSLVEIWDTNIDPQAIFLSSPPIYQITTQTTSLLYGLAEPQLLEGKRYAWRVKAQALDGIDEIGLFKNNGYSEIFSFTYQGECNAPSYLTVEEVGTKTVTFRWQGEIDHTQYKIDYRKAVDNDGNTGEQNTNHWFESTTNREEFIVIDLESNTMYEWRVGGYCADGTLSFAESTTFTTMAEEVEAYYNCGIEPSINIANQLLLDELQVGDVIKAGDFNVKIQEVSGNSSFSGKGYTTVGFLKNLKIALEFTNIQVNTEYQFVNGEIKTVYDPTWSNILDIDEVIDEFEDIVDVFTGDDIVIITLDYDISESDITVDTDSGQIIINNPNGSPSTFDYDTGDTYTITDASGDQFEIDANGEVTQTGFGAEGGPVTADNTFGITNGHGHNVGDPSVRNIERHAIGFIYKKGTNTKYELDQQNNDYEEAKYPKVTIDGGNHYYPVHKAIVEGGAEDYFIVDIANNTNYINNDSLIFKTVSGTKIDAVKEGANSYKITVRGRNSYTNEEAIITYKDTLGKQHILSSFFIHHIKKFPAINVNVVLVNGATDIDGLQAKLDAIYKPTGVTFNVGNTETLTISQAEWDVDVANGKIDYNGSGLASDHPKELRAIKNYYKNQNSGYDSKAYHLFVLDYSMSVTKALAGFMPKKNQWGFLFEAHYSTNIQNKGTVSTIVAHELGHGVFALGHPFGEDENNSGTASTWLMDYTNGTELAYPNWAKMSDDSLQLHLFQDDEDNEANLLTLDAEGVLEQISDEINNYNDEYSYFTPSGSLISFVNKPSKVFFAKSNNTNYANGTIQGFIADNTEYIGLFYNNKNEFAYYYRKDKYNEIKNQFENNLRESHLKQYPDYEFQKDKDYKVVSSGKVRAVLTGSDCNQVEYIWNTDSNISTLKAPLISQLNVPENLNGNSLGQGNCIPAGPGKEFYDYTLINNQLSEQQKAEIREIALLYNQIGNKLIGDYNTQTRNKFNRLSFTQRILYEISVKENGYDFNLYKNKLIEYLNKFDKNKTLLQEIDEQDRAVTLLNNLSKTQIENLDMGLRIQALKALTSERMRGKFYTLWGLTNDSNSEDEALRLLRYTPKFQNKELIDSLIYNKDLLIRLEKGFNDIGWIYDDGNFKVFASDILSAKFLFLNKGDLSDKLSLYENVHNNNHVFKWTSHNFLAVQDGELKYSSTLNNSGNINIEITQIVGYTTTWTGNSSHQAPIYKTENFDDLKPFEWVALYTEKSIPALEFSSNSMHFIPAILFHYIIQDNINENTQKSLNIAVDIASLAIGIGEIKAGISTARVIFATVDVIISAGDIVIISFEDQIINSFGNEGKIFIERFNTIAAIVGITNIGYEGVIKVKKIFDEDLVKVADFWAKNNEKIKTLLSEAQFKGYDDYVSDLKTISSTAGRTIDEILASLQNKVPTDKWDNFISDFGDDVTILSWFDGASELINNWEMLYRNSRSGLRVNPDALQALNTLLGNPKLASKLPGKSTTEIEDLLCKIKGWGDGTTGVTYKQVCDKVNELINELPTNTSNLDNYLGSAGFGNGNVYTNRHSFVQLERILEAKNKTFINSADEVIFENSISTSFGNSVSDIFIKKGNRIIEIETKAGLQFFEGVSGSNFSTQSANSLTRVASVSDYKVVLNPERIATLSNSNKISVINAWKNHTNDFFGNPTIRQKFSEYWDDIIINNNAQFENLLNTRNDWFDDIFKNNID